MIKQNRYYSYQLGELQKGCQYCVRGEKLVLFLTGLCPRKCSFCPIAEQKYQKDVTFANERAVKKIQDVFKEIELMRARGAGITGGDPLARLKKTLGYIKKIKQKFGKGFHLHLYTSLNLVTPKNLQELSAAGLDEIRFHLDLNDKKFWKKIKWARKFSWDVGVEIPLIPGKDYQKLIDYLADKIDFLNLNELEFADNKQFTLEVKTKNPLSYAVQESLELGKAWLEYIKKRKYQFKTHLCTVKLKDGVQLANRIKREAEQARHAFDLVDEEGMLTRGALYLDELKPDFGYQEKLEKTKKSLPLKKLRLLLKEIKKEFPQEEFYLDQEKIRILLSKKFLKKRKKELAKWGLKPAVVKEYPTADQLEMEVEFLHA